MNQFREDTRERKLIIQDEETQKKIFYKFLKDTVEHAKKILNNQTSHLNL